MKYFEIHYPYYALIKANNEQEAIKKYVEQEHELMIIDGNLL